MDDRLQSMSQFHKQQLLAEQQERSNLEETYQKELQEAYGRLAQMDDLILERDKLSISCSKLEEDRKSVV